MQVAPESLQLVQPLLLQPRSELAIGLDARLQGPECVESGRQVCQPGRFGIDELLLGAPLIVQFGGTELQFFKPRVSHVSGFQDFI